MGTVCAEQDVTADSVTTLAMHAAISNARPRRIAALANGSAI
jgi:hypothetical protein